MKTTTAVMSSSLDAAYRHEWQPFEADPGPLVVLAGCQRSGTTLLHVQLARSGAFRFISAYDVYASDRLVHNARAGLVESTRAEFLATIEDQGDRGIDGIPAGPDAPEEYGLVIAADASELRYNRPETTPATVPLLRELCAKKALLEGRARPLLLKSPPDYPDGLACLAAAWPNARFVAIQRHPLHTLQSQVRAWREMLRNPNPYMAALDPGYRALFGDRGRRMRAGLFLHSRAGVDWLADSILRAHLGFVALLEQPAAPDMLMIRYEDLCADQAAAFRALSGFLRLDLAEPDSPPSPRTPAISAEVLDAFAARRDAFAPYLERFGYQEVPA